jgi:hypothetical protein
MQAVTIENMILIIERYMDIFGTIVRTDEK